MQELVFLCVEDAHIVGTRARGRGVQRLHAVLGEVAQRAGVLPVIVAAALGGLDLEGRHALALVLGGHYAHAGNIAGAGKANGYPRFRAGCFVRVEMPADFRFQQAPVAAIIVPLVSRTDEHNAALGEHLARHGFVLGQVITGARFAVFLRQQLGQPLEGLDVAHLFCPDDGLAENFLAGLIIAARVCQGFDADLHQVAPQVLAALLADVVGPGEHHGGVFLAAAGEFQQLAVEAHRGFFILGVALGNHLELVVEQVLDGPAVRSHSFHLLPEAKDGLAQVGIAQTAAGQAGVHMQAE